MPVGAGEGEMLEEERFESLNLEFECTPSKKKLFSPILYYGGLVNPDAHTHKKIIEAGTA